jgi:hypothetical protein
MAGCPRGIRRIQPVSTGIDLALRSAERVHIMLRVTASVLAGLLAAALPAAPRAADAPHALPRVLDAFLSDAVRPTVADRDALMSGRPLVSLLDADPAKEVAVFGAIWVNASASQYVAAVSDIELFERGDAVRATKRVSDPPQSSDFDAMSITDEDFRELKDCKVGGCALKIDEAGLEAFRAGVDWRKPTAKAEANTVIRRLAREYVNGYRQGGNARLAVYRDKDRPTFVAEEFRSMIDRLPRLGVDMPDLKAYLLGYPEATLPGSTDFIYWQQAEFGLKPIVRVNHLVIQQRADRTVIASKMLYASHYFWTALELRVLVPDPARGQGFWFVVVNRARSDGLSGFTGSVVRGRVRGELQKSLARGLVATKSKLES